MKVLSNYKSPSGVCISRLSFRSSRPPLLFAVSLNDLLPSSSLQPDLSFAHPILPHQTALSICVGVPDQQTLSCVCF